MKEAEAMVGLVTCLCLVFCVLSKTNHCETVMILNRGLSSNE